MELIPQDTARIGIYKDMSKCRDIHIEFGTASLCVGFRTYALAILCDHISRTLQTVDMELACIVLLDTARTCKRLGMNPREVLGLGFSLEQTSVILKTRSIIR